MSKSKAAAKTESQTAASDIKWFVYLLRCRDGSLYTGITNDLPRRLEQHNAGTASRYTRSRSRLPVHLLLQMRRRNGWQKMEPSKKMIESVQQETENGNPREHYK